MSEESELQREWRDIVITKLNNIEAEQKLLQRSVSENVIIANDVKTLHSETKDLRIMVKEIEMQTKSEYVTKIQFALVEKLVYGTVATVLLAVGGAILALVIMKN